MSRSAVLRSVRRLRSLTAAQQAGERSDEQLLSAFAERGTCLDGDARIGELQLRAGQTIDWDEIRIKSLAQLRDWTIERKVQDVAKIRCSNGVERELI